MESVSLGPILTERSKESNAEPDPPVGEPRQSAKCLYRTLGAFFILGICNNYGYVVMLSAANDILHDQTPNNVTNGNIERGCNYISTGAILLADIVPSLFIKFTAPFLPRYINVRVILCIMLAAVGYLVVAFSTAQWMAIFGVVLTSLSSGLGEVTFLQLSVYYDKKVIASWSSGTGGAGVAGALSYICLNLLGLQNALLIMLVVPLCMGIAFYIVLPNRAEPSVEKLDTNNKQLDMKEKLHLLPGLTKYILPLFLVFLFEYFINQGIYELIQFENSSLSKASQYRYLQLCYQIGVFISRSSAFCMHISRIWIFPILQMVCVVLFVAEALCPYFPYFEILACTAVFEGFVGGAAYVNTYYKISIEAPESHKEFSLGATTISDAVGISLAGVVAIYAHNAICNLPLICTLRKV